MLKAAARQESYDLVVIGSGPAGQRAAVQAAKLKKKVLIVEKQALGGSCLHTGTIPSKTLREAALNPQLVVHDPLKSVMRRKEVVIRDEMSVIEKQLERNGVEWLPGSAKFISMNRLSVDNAIEVEAKNIIIAVGSRPHRVDNLVFDDKLIVDSDTILNIKDLPVSLAVIGAGVIGCEYASIFAKLGVRVTIFDRRDHLLRFVDKEVTEALEKHFRDNHIELKLNADISGINPVTGLEKPQVEVRWGQESFLFDTALYCMGRNGNTSDLNLGATGITTDSRGLIAVNEFYQTSVPHIYAVGDVIGNPALAASSSEQGRLAALHAFQQPSGGFPKTFPYGIYTIPEISCVGTHEEDLKTLHAEYVVGRAFYRELARGKILDDNHGFLKILVDKNTRKILGIHILGTGATELIHVGQVAMALGASIDFLVNNVFNYPTLAEAYKVAALNAANQLRQ